MPCQFTILNGTRAGSAFRFDQPSFRVGRDPRCELAFDPNVDLTVSGVHATVSFINGVYQLQDSSSNGTFANNVQVQGAIVLTEGMVLELGRGGPQIRFSLAAVVAQPMAPQAVAPMAPQAVAPMAQAPQAVAPQ
ncbi:MAG: FHA domain-containing protein, partial [Deltaproteobacteria bacterium]|nr:FHA domain-containing protein [Deltaproteobacteria bacterium]